MVDVFPGVVFGGYLQLQFVVPKDDLKHLAPKHVLYLKAFSFDSRNLKAQYSCKKIKTSVKNHSLESEGSHYGASQTSDLVIRVALGLHGRLHVVASKDETSAHLRG